MTSETLPKRLGLIAGEGQLPLRVARTAQAQGAEVVAFSLCWNNRLALRQLCAGRLHAVVPGLVSRTLELLRRENVEQVVFAGKVNKWILLRDPRLDRRAWEALQTLTPKNDDAVMLKIIDELAREGIDVVPQTDYLQELFLPPGVLGIHPPNEAEQADIRYGFELAREMGRLDVGQTVVVKDGMILAVEAIEGTDRCLERAGKLARGKGGVVIKVEKPGQDARFDVPTVGLRTLQTMKKFGLNVLATEAHKTFFLEPEAMGDFANRHGIRLISVDGEAFSP